MRLLLIAADPMEYAGVLSHARGVRPVSLGIRWARSADVGGQDALLAANGVGAGHAAAAVDAAAAHHRPQAVVGTGYCGALDESLHIAGVVVGDRVMGGGTAYPALPVASAAAFRRGAVCSVDRVVRTAAEKRELGSAGACAVEMEAYGVAARAAALGLPFYCIKAVTDLAREDMANDFNAALRPDGHFDTISILGRALRRPTVRLPELLRLRSRCILAARALGEFFADCRF